MGEDVTLDAPSPSPEAPLLSEAGASSASTSVGAGAAGDLHDGEEAVPVSRPRGPREPTPREVEDHVLTGHAAYRSWCAHCVRGRGSAAPHRTSDHSDENDVPVLSFDY